MKYQKNFILSFSVTINSIYHYSTQQALIEHFLQNFRSNISSKYKKKLGKLSTLQASSRPCTPINRCAASDCRRTFPIPDDWRLCFVQARSGIQKPATGALLCDSCNRWRRTTKSNRPWPSNGILKLVCTTVSRVKRNWPGVYTYWLVVAGQATGVIACLRESYVTTRQAESNDPPISLLPIYLSKNSLTREIWKFLFGSFGSILFDDSLPFEEKIRRIRW